MQWWKNENMFFTSALQLVFIVPDYTVLNCVYYNYPEALISFSNLLTIHWRCNMTEQLPVYFNCTSIWPRHVGFFSWALQAQMRHNFILGCGKIFTE